MKQSNNESKNINQRYKNILHGQMKAMLIIMRGASIHDTASISSLAVHLSNILLQKKHKFNGKKHTLFEFVYNDLQVPRVLSCKQFIIDRCLSEKLNPCDVVPSIYKAHSFLVCNGFVKLVIPNHYEKCSMKDVLKTDVLLNRVGLPDKLPFFSIERIIEWVRHKDGAHIEVDPHLKNDFEKNKLGFISDRHSIIWGIAEYLLAVIEEIEIIDEDIKVWKLHDNHFSNVSSYHINHSDLEGTLKASKISGPLFMGSANGGKNSFIIAPYIYGINFLLSQVSPDFRFIVNDRGEIKDQFLIENKGELNWS